MSTGHPGGERFRKLLRRTIDALQRSAHLVAESRRIQSVSGELITARGVDPDPNAPGEHCQTVWSSEDGLISCSVVARTASAHEVAVTMAGQVVASRVFMDPVEATDEAERLRHLFLDPVRRSR